MIAEAILFSFIKNNLIKMQTSASRRVNILYIYFKIRSFLITTLLAQVYVRFDTLFPCGKYLHHFREDYDT